MDLKSLKPSETTEVQIFHPVTGESLGIFIEILSRDSKEYFAAKHAEESRVIRSGVRERTADDIQKIGNNLLAAVTKSWREEVDGNQVPTLNFGGEHLECTPENAAMVYSELRWLRDQIDSKVHDRSAFLTNALKS